MKVKLYVKISRMIPIYDTLPEVFTFMCIYITNYIYNKPEF